MILSNQTYIVIIGQVAFFNNPFIIYLFFLSFFRFLLKTLLQYQSVSEGDVLPTPSSGSLPPVPPVALTSGPAGPSGLSVPHNLTSVVSAGEEALLKKPKKERKERGKENGKEECKCEERRVFVWLIGQWSARVGQDDICVSDSLVSTVACWKGSNFLIYMRIAS